VSKKGDIMREANKGTNGRQQTAKKKKKGQKKMDDNLSASNDRQIMQQHVKYSDVGQ